ncbi:phosphatidylcholine synthase [Bartonella vinsonii]|uniref:phosphatidylcholine synthase n=1 Tax=Bartonella vinsonii TaxID=33047 RepID=UPI0002FEBBE0|nr:phosphatidylcholine/phosphatidylserine synthase [Bartonella vinsonii]
MDENFRNEDKKTLKRKLTKKIKTNADLLRHKKVTMPQAKAFSVHLLTASGSFLAFLSLISASQKEWTAMFCWLGLALLVDGIDGPIARKLDVKYVLPTWSGELLDNIIDYVTYVLIPAFALYQSGLMGAGLSFLLSAIIVISSAIYYADTGMKTKENFFKGFPVVWNMMVFMLFVVKPGEWITFTIIALSAIISFLPIYFIHPVRVIRLRWLNFPIFLLWCSFGVAAFFYQLDAPYWVKIGISITGIYMYCIGAIMQLFPQLGSKNKKKQ